MKKKIQNQITNEKHKDAKSNQIKPINPKNINKKKKS